MLVLARLVLVRARQRRQCGEEGLPLQPPRRRGLPDRGLPGLLQDRHPRLQGNLLPPVAHRRRHRHRRLPAAVRRRRGQVRPAPAVPLVGRRHGGPHAGLGPHPRRHHGHRRCVPDVPHQPPVGTVPRRPAGRGLGGGCHCLRGRHHRVRATGHQEGARLLHRVAARLHVPRRGRGRLRGRHLPHGGPRLLQGTVVPGGGVGDPRPARRAGPQTDGEPAPLHEAHVPHLRHRHPGHRRDPPAVGLLRQGRRPRQRLRPLPRPVGHRPRRRRAHRVLHDQAGVAGLLRQRPVASGLGRFCGWPRWRCRTARGALGDGTPVGGAGGACLRRRRPASSLASELGPPGLVGTGLRHRSVPGPPVGGIAVDPRRRRHRGGPGGPVGGLRPVVASSRAARARAGGAPARLLPRRRLRRRDRPARTGLRPLLRHGDRGQGHRRRRERGGAASRAPREGACGGCRRASYASTRSASCWVASSCWPGCCRGRCHDLRRRLSLPHRARAPPRRRGPGGGARSRLDGRARPARCGVRDRHGGQRRHPGPRHHHRRALPGRQRRIPPGEPARVGVVAGRLVAPGGRRHLRVPRPHGGHPVPPGHRGRQGARPTPVVRGLDAAPRGGMPGELRLARPDPVLLVLRADPGARVLRDRGMGLLTARLRGHQVLRVHLPRLGLPPGGDRGRRLHPPAPDRAPHLRPRGAERHPPGPGLASPAVPGLHRRLRREGPDLPLPHVVARRLCPVAHRRSGDPGRRHGQDGHLRHHPFRPQPVPAGRGRPRPAAAHLGRGQHPLRGRGGLRHARPEAPGGVLLAQPSRVRRARDLRAHHPGRHRRRAADGEPRSHHRRAVHRDRLDLRTATDVAGQRAAGAAAGRTGDGGGVHRGHDGRHRAARPQRLRGGVPRAGRHLPLPPVVGGGRHRWRRARRAVSLVGVPAGVPSRARRGRPPRCATCRGARSPWWHPSWP